MEGTPLSVEKPDDEEERRKNKLEGQKASGDRLKKPENIGFLAVESEPPKPSMLEAAWAKTGRSPESDEAENEPPRPGTEIAPDAPAEETPEAPPPEPPAPEAPPPIPPPPVEILPQEPLPGAETAEPEALPEAAEPAPEPEPAPAPASETAPEPAPETPEAPPEPEPPIERIPELPPEPEPAPTPPVEQPAPVQEASVEIPPVEAPPEESVAEAEIPQPPEAAELPLPAPTETIPASEPERPPEPPAEETIAETAPEITAQSELEPSTETVAEIPSEQSADYPPEQVETVPQPEELIAEQGPPEAPPTPAEQPPEEERSQETDRSRLNFEEEGRETGDSRQQTAAQAENHRTFMQSAAATELTRSSRAAEQKMDVESAPIGPLAGRNVETLSQQEMLDMAEEIMIDDKSLRHAYETKMIGEHGLRRLLAEYQQGGDMRVALRREILEHQIDFERDPAMRDQAAQSQVSQALSDTPKSEAGDDFIHRLLQNSEAIPDLHEDTAPSHPQPPIYQTDDSHAWHSSRNRSKAAVDALFVSVISILFLLVIFLYISRR